MRLQFPSWRERYVWRSRQKSQLVCACISLTDMYFLLCTFFIGQYVTFLSRIIACEVPKILFIKGWRVVSQLWTSMYLLTGKRYPLDLVQRQFLPTEVIDYWPKAPSLKMSVCCSETKWTVFEILVVEHSWTIKNKWINSREATQTGNGTISDVSPTIKFLYFSDCVVWKLLIVIPGQGGGEGRRGAGL